MYLKLGWGSLVLPVAWVQRRHVLGTACSERRSPMSGATDLGEKGEVSMG
jgi:hypothetical protein